MSKQEPHSEKPEGEQQMFAMVMSENDRAWYVVFMTEKEADIYHPHTTDLLEYEELRKTDYEASFVRSLSLKSRDSLLSGQLYKFAKRSYSTFI
ncbi:MULTISPECIES: hypothetical protein [Persicobacter]|uniref:Uncharacterized protein n=1 Tax=Persicobacter diffluens TaxID=981 RepID=A0AAN4VV14_9BACT|nr:hypothetical protein [Persicobacter sp. CCB-QB2]GJM60218.1 hypothetical protein PEDI_07700 [Persicobacter diffluens]